MTDLTTVEEINVLIRRIETDAEMKEIYQTIKDQRDRITRRIRLSFSPGDSVEFNSKKGGLVQGTVIRLMKKNVLVQAEKKLPGGTSYPVEWTVHPSLLRTREEVPS